MNTMVAGSVLLIGLSPRPTAPAVNVNPKVRAETRATVPALNSLNPQARQETRMTSITLIQIDHLARGATTSPTIAALNEAIIDYIGANELPEPVRSQLRRAMFESETKWHYNPETGMPADTFISSATALIERLGLSDYVTISPSGLFTVRASLASIMPHVFVPPSTSDRLRPLERLYLLFLLWDNGGLGRDSSVMKPIGSGTHTTARFTNGDRSAFISKRNSRLQQIGVERLQEACDEAITMVSTQ